MQIEQLSNNHNHYEVYENITDEQPIAEFDVVENRRTGETGGGRPLRPETWGSDPDGRRIWVQGLCRPDPPLA